jgi:CheY-like chemotaxis protein
LFLLFGSKKSNFARKINVSPAIIAGRLAHELDLRGYKNVWKKFSHLRRDGFAFRAHMTLFYPTKKITESQRERLSSLFSDVTEMSFHQLALGSILNEEIEINHTEYDLVILDINLPHKNGIEICREVRSQDIKIPIIMLTANDTVDDNFLIPAISACIIYVCLLF